MPSGRPRYPGLTPREQEVYELLLQGLTNRQIAERLGISLDGAKYHVSQILMKLDVSTREEAIALTGERRVFGLASIGAVLRKLSLGTAMKAGGAAILFGSVVVAALIAIAILVDPTGSEDEDTAAAELPLTLDGTSSVFLALLEHIPAADDSALYFSDYAAARRLARIQPPSQDGDQGELIQYWALLSQAGMEQNPTSANFTNNGAAFNSELGFNIANLDASVHLRPKDGECGGAHAFAGRFDAARIDRALRQTASFRDAVSNRTHAGVDYFHWHDGCGEQGAPGGPGQVVLAGDFVYWSSQSVVDTLAMIEAASGSAPTLSTNATHQLIAQSFADLGVFSAYLEVHADPLWFEPLRELAENEYGRNAPSTVQTQGYLRPYGAMAVGVGHDEESTYAVLVLVHANEQDASTNAALLQQRVASGTRYRGRPWSDTITRSDIKAVGTVVQARLWAPHPKFLFQAWSDLDSLFVSKP